jgi:PE family
MSFVSVVPDSIAEAARVLDQIGSSLSAARTSAGPTTAIAVAAQDEVSSAIAQLFENFGQDFRVLNAEAQAFHDQFVGALNAGTAQYVSAEAANVQLNLLNALNAPGEALLGQPLVGTGAGLLGTATSVLDTPFSMTVYDQPTPFGPIVLTMNGYGSLLGLGGATITSGSLEVPTPIVLAVDAIGPEANVAIALANSGTAFTNAVQTGNPVAAAAALVNAPAGAVNGFFFGHQSVSMSFPLPSDTGYTTAEFSLPVGGLLAPPQPVTTTLTSTDGTLTSFPLSGTEFGGLIPTLAAEIPGV